MTEEEFSFRVGVAYLVLAHIRRQLQQGKRYNALQGPNIQSALDALLIPWDVLSVQVTEGPFKPSQTMLDTIRANWQRDFSSDELLLGKHLPC